MVEFSCALSHIQSGIFMPVFFFPYYLRAYRLYLIHSAHLEHFALKRKHGVFGFKQPRSLHFVREKNMLKWFLVIMIPIIVVTLVAVSIPTVRIYFPSFEVKTCLLGSDYYIVGPEKINQRFQFHLFITIEFYLLFNFLMDALLMILLFVLRNI